MVSGPVSSLAGGAWPYTLRPPGNVTCILKYTNIRKDVKINSQQHISTST